MAVTQIKTLGALPLTPQPTYSTEKVGGGGATLKENKKFLILGGITYDHTNKNPRTKSETSFIALGAMNKPMLLSGKS